MSSEVKIEFSELSVKEMRELHKNLKFFNPAQANAFRSGLRQAVAVIANAAKKKVPKFRGNARKSIKPKADLGAVGKKGFYAQKQTTSTGKTFNRQITPQQATRPGFIGVTAGGPDAPYFKWLDFGGTTGRGHKMGKGKGAIKRKFIDGGRYMYPTLDEKRSEVRDLLADAFNQAVEDLSTELLGGR